MPTIRDVAICIRHWDWSETSQTVSLFTREHGLVRGLAKGSKREKSPFSGGVELLTRGEVVAITRSTGAMSTITAWDLQETFTGARKSVRAFFVGSYLLDLIHHAVTDADPHPALFDALDVALSMLGPTPDISLLLGQWAVLAETGYRPEVHRDVRTGGSLDESQSLMFVARLGGFVTGQATASEGWGVRPETLRLLRVLDAGDPREITQNDETIGRAVRLLASYLRHVLGVELPSLGSLFGAGDLLR